MMPKYCDEDKLKHAIHEFVNEYGKIVGMSITDFNIMLERNRVDVKPTEEQLFNEWCYDCKEYDKEAHCCHRWTKVIRNTVNDLKTQGYEIVRHGHWINERNPMMYQSYPYVWVCDQCGTAFYYKTPYCGECGAKMDERREDGQ